MTEIELKKRYLFKCIVSIKPDDKNKADMTEVVVGLPDKKLETVLEALNIYVTDKWSSKLNTLHEVQSITYAGEFWGAV